MKILLTLLAVILFPVFCHADCAEKGVDWEAYRVVVKVIKTKKGWLVDGAGSVNIPKDKQAPRD
jgi:hypothetical protein